MHWQHLDGLIAEFETASSRARILPHDWREVWALAKEIGEGFRVARYPTKTGRDVAWERFCAARREATATQDLDWAERRSRSEWHHDYLIGEIESCRPHDLFGVAPPDRDEMKALGARLRGAGRYLSEHKEDMVGEHKGECFTRIKDVQEAHDAWWEVLRGDRERRHGEWRARVETNLDRLRDRHARLAEVLDRKRTQASDLRGRIAVARNDDWRSNAEGWLAELEEAIEEIEGKLENIDGWIAEEEEKLARS